MKTPSTLARWPSWSMVLPLVAWGGVESGCRTSSPPPPQAAPAPEAASEPSRPPPAPRNPERAEQLLEQGRQIQRERGEGGSEQAIERYRAALEADPQCAACYWEIGWSSQTLGRWDACVDAWDQTRRLDPDFPELSEHYPVAVMRRDQARALASLPPASPLPVEQEPRPGPVLTLRAVGDVHMGRAWPAARATLPPHDGADLFAKVAPWLSEADVTFGNLETVLMDEGESTKCGPRSTRCYAFRVPTSYAKVLRDAGFDLMSIANNHTGDFGEAGRTQTMQALDAVGIKHSGPVGDIASLEVHGLRIAMVAFSTGAGVYRVQQIDVAEKLVADLDRTHDLVWVSFHGGAEGAKAAHVPKETEYFLGENRGDLRRFAHAVIDAGADVVLGHGPHRLRGMEIYRGRLVAYSLGNFSSWETFNLKGALGQTTVLDLSLAPNGVLLNANLLPVRIEEPGRPAPDPNKHAITTVRKLSAEDFGQALFSPAGTYVRPASANRAKTDESPPQSGS